MHNANLSKTNLSLKIVIAHTRAVHQVIVQQSVLASIGQYQSC